MSRGGRIRIAFAVAILPCATARADELDADAQAQRLYRTGQEHFEAGRMEEAIDAFQRGHRASPRPEFLLNLAQCHRALGRIDDAIRYFEQFVSADPGHRLRPDVERTIAELRAERPPAAAPGPAVLRTSVEAPSGGSEPPARIAARPARPRPGRPSRTWVWVVVAAAGAAVAGAVTAAIVLGGDADPPLLGTVSLDPAAR